MHREQRTIVNVGVVGLGFIGQVHFKAYERAVRDDYPCQVAAVCDQSAERRAGRLAHVGNLRIREDEASTLFNPDELDVYADYSELLSDDSIDLISICTHTDTHVSFAIDALEAGKHVLIEKPVAIDANGVERVVSAAQAHPDQIIMPAMCMRFWPGWTWLKVAVTSHAYGRVRSAVFRRLGCGPSWAREFYHDVSRSGGAALDLHIHDVDFLYHLFGRPNSVCSNGDLLHLTTAYHYEAPDRPGHVVAEGGWHNTPGVPFQMGATIVFERAVAHFDLNADHPLTIYHHDETTQFIALDDVSGYEGEIRHIIDLITGKTKTPIATIEDALAVAHILDAERRSLEFKTRQTVPAN